MPGIFIFVVLIGVALVITVAILGHLWEKKRREAFQALARQLGMRYTQRDDSIATRYQFLDKLRQGESRYAFNILAGDFEGHAVQAFDYHYVTRTRDSKGRRHSQHHYFSFFLLELPRNFPELRIYPEGLFSKFGQMLGFDDIDFESVEFSRAFCVRSTDKKFAYDICHTRMMELLLRDPALSLEIEGPCLAMSFSSRLDPQQIPSRLRQLVEIRELFPDYLLRE